MRTRRRRKRFDYNARPRDSFGLGQEKLCDDVINALLWTERAAAAAVG